MNNADKPAMPCETYDRHEETMICETKEYTGLTKREYFAAMAMQGAMSTLSTPERSDAMVSIAKATGKSVSQVIALQAIQQADALLKELEK